MTRLLSLLFVVSACAGCGHSATAPTPVTSGVSATPTSLDLARCLQGTADATCFSAATLSAQIVQGAAAVNAPERLTASAAGSSVTLTWTAAAGDAPTSYVIEAGSATGQSNLANFSTGNTATTYSASGIGAGTYYVRVRARTATSVSSASNEAVLVVSACAAPAAPGSLTLTANSGGTVAFSWTAASGATTYVIEAGSRTTLSDLANGDLGSAATTFTTSGVGSGVYYVRLRAKNSCGTSTASNEVVVTVGARTGPSDLVFIPDAGFRINSGGIPSAGVDASGAVYLYYSDGSTGRDVVAIATDGLTFGAGSTVTTSNRANDPRRTLLPDGTWRLYQWDNRTGVMTSLRSTDGISFSSESGTRYTPSAADNGTIGVYDAYTEGSRVILLYLGDLMGANNERRAVSTDNGVTFTFDATNVLGDAASGGGARSYVDPRTLKLPDGRRRLFAMRAGSEIDSFISSDGLNYSLEAGTRLLVSDFTSFTLRSLNDPTVVRLPDGRYRMYVAALVSGTQYVIVSATTSTGASGSTSSLPFPLRRSRP